ncbi:hypothetical protein TNCV_1126351 [Trichonephila clavipes]|nr:hypothetical protein TNCV_1126351 [Trichonephila clavipes]
MLSSVDVSNMSRTTVSFDSNEEFRSLLKASVGFFVVTKSVISGCLFDNITFLIVYIIDIATRVKEVIVPLGGMSGLKKTVLLLFLMPPDLDCDRSRPTKFIIERS